MEKYFFSVVVDRTVTDTLSLAVDADNIQDAIEMAAEAARRFPNHQSVPRVSHCLTENREVTESKLEAIERVVRTDD